MFYFAHCINIIFNSLLVQLVKYDVHTTRKIKFMHAIIYHILLFYGCFSSKNWNVSVCTCIHCSWVFLSLIT